MRYNWYRKNGYICSFGWAYKYWKNESILWGNLRSREPLNWDSTILQPLSFGNIIQCTTPQHYTTCNWRESVVILMQRECLVTGRLNVTNFRVIWFQDICKYQFYIYKWNLLTVEIRRFNITVIKICYKTFSNLVTISDKLSPAISVLEVT